MKYNELPYNHEKGLVAPFAGAWIEIMLLYPWQARLRSSLPSRERGLKYTLFLYFYAYFSPSLPSRERGLKYTVYDKVSVYVVAPFAGAWIEIKTFFMVIWQFIVSLPSRERGLKYCIWFTVQTADSRSLRGSVD